MSGKRPFVSARVLWIGAALVAAVSGAVMWSSRGDDVSAPLGTVEPRDGHPSVVLIVIDTLRADALGSYGHPLPTSPELDAIAERGVRFAQVFSQSSWTRPSFASMLTSLPPRASGITEERMHALPAALETLPEILQGEGYVTLGVTANPNINSTFAFDQGYDEYVDSGVRFGWMDEEALPGDQLHGQVPLMTAPVVFERALELVDAHADGGPVYLMVDLMDVHERNDPRVLDGSEWATTFDDHPDDNYLTALREVSAKVAAFIAALENRPRFHEKTLYVITSDHGEGLRSHPHVRGGRDHGYHVYESQVRVPLIMHHSRGRLPAGRVVESPVRLLDLTPTILDLLGIQRPDVMEGRSLRPEMNGASREASPRVVETHFRGAHALGVYGDDFVYVEHRNPWPGTEPREVQRLGAEQDGALTNRIEDEPEIAERLRAVLAAWEEEHAMAPPTQVGQPLRDEEIEQLRALGYVE